MGKQASSSSWCKEEYSKEATLVTSESTIFNTKLQGIGGNDYSIEHNTNDDFLGGYTNKKKLCRSPNILIRKISTDSKHLKSLNIGEVCNSSNSSNSNSNRFVDITICSQKMPVGVIYN